MGTSETPTTNRVARDRNVTRLSSWVHDFVLPKPRNRAAQDDALNWLAAAHARSELLKADTVPNSGTPQSLAELCSKYERLLSRVGVKPAVVSHRDSELADFTTMDVDSMTVFNTAGGPTGAAVNARMQVFSAAVMERFDDLYPKSESQPCADLLHVSCTGYESPSAAQKLVANRGWATRVTHFYHMGCYAALPAVRVAAGLLNATDRVDIVHSELCSLHFDPSNHSLEQLVVQSLFADGYAKYSVTSAPPHNTSALELMASLERIAPDSSNAMTWNLAPFGLAMQLSREVPDLIGLHIDAAFRELCSLAKLDLEYVRTSAQFAIHPGGPKIIESAADALGLSDWQTTHSKRVLFEHGNMSSATIPHVWARMLSDENVKHGQTIVSFAFGPGLTIAANLLRKSACSERSRKSAET